MKVIDLDKLEWEFVHDSDQNEPIIPKGGFGSKKIKFITKESGLSYHIFENLGLEEVYFDFDISFDLARDHGEWGIKPSLNILESSGEINLYDSDVKSNVIKCKRLVSFASTLEFKELDCDELEFELTKVIDSENVSTSSSGIVHTDHGVVLCDKKFKLNILYLKI